MSEEASASEPPVDAPPATSSSQPELRGTSSTKSGLTSTPGSRRNPRATLKPLEVAAQARYEKCLLDEIMKLQDTLVIQQTLLSDQQSEAEQKALAESRARKDAGEKASRLAMLEAAANDAQAEEAMAVQKRRAAADERLAERERQANAKRKLAARKKEEQRLLAAEMHKETMSRFADEMAEQEHARQEKTSAKEAALHARLAQERQETLARNSKKADEAAAKIDRAAEQRRMMLAEQQKIFHERHLAQEARMASMAEEEEARKREVKRKATEKKVMIERAQEQQQVLQEERRNSILRKEAQKQAELDRKAVEIDDVRYERQQERLKQHAASRGRVDQRMGETKAKMEHLEQSMGERYAKVEEFELLKATHVHSAHQMAVRSGLHKQSMHYAMQNMREQAAKAQTVVRLDVPPHIRANIQNEQLRTLLDRMDEKGEGQISLKSMRTVLAQDAKLDQPKPKRGMRHAQSQPTMSLKGKSDEEKLIDAFREADKDSSGTISKREMFGLLERIGIDRHSSRMKLFRGFDVDDDGIITFDEFKKLAAAL